jgi:hypothetical protein
MDSSVNEITALQAVLVGRRIALSPGADAIVTGVLQLVPEWMGELTVDPPLAPASIH